MRSLRRASSLLILSVPMFLGCSSLHSQDKATQMTTDLVSLRVWSLIRVRPEFEERYLILHKHVFPGVLESIHRSNIRNYSIFLRDGILFSYFEYVGHDYEADMKGIGDTVTKEWWKLTDPMQEPLAERKKGEWWATMDPAFDLESTTSPNVSVERLAFVAQVKDGQEDGVRTLLKTDGESLVPYLRRGHFANVHFYLHGASLYMYAEYSGADLTADRALLNNDPGWRDWNRRLLQLLSDPLQEMRPAFHTN